MHINELLEGESAVIAKCENKRLNNHGFIEGTIITAYKKLFGVSAYFLRGAIIACRDKDSDSIIVYVPEKSNSLENYSEIIKNI